MYKNRIKKVTKTLHYQGVQRLQSDFFQPVTCLGATGKLSKIEKTILPQPLPSPPPTTWDGSIARHPIMSYCNDIECNTYLVKYPLMWCGTVGKPGKIRSLRIKWHQRWKFSQICTFWTCGRCIIFLVGLFLFIFFFLPLLCNYFL